MSSNNYKIGYKRPPTAHAFKPGQSGNPAGRPKGRKKFATLLQEIVNRKVPIAGSTKKITMGEAVLRKIFSSAVTGDAKAQEMVLGLMESYLGVDVNSGFDPELRAREQSILAQLFTGQGDGDESDSD